MQLLLCFWYHMEPTRFCLGKRSQLLPRILCKSSQLQVVPPNYKWQDGTTKLWIIGACRRYLPRGVADLYRVVPIPELAWLVAEYSSKLSAASRSSRFMSSTFRCESAHPMKKECIHRSYVYICHDVITVARANLAFLGGNIPWNIPCNDAWRPLATPQ